MATRLISGPHFGFQSQKLVSAILVFFLNAGEEIPDLLSVDPPLSLRLAYCSFRED